MISEELVASGGTHVHEADIPERPPKTRATREPRVSVLPSCLERHLGSRGPGGQGGGGAGDASRWFSLTLIPFASRAHGWLGWGAVQPVVGRKPQEDGCEVTTASASPTTSTGQASGLETAK